MVRIFRPQLRAHDTTFIRDTLALIIDGVNAQPLPGHVATPEQMHEQQRVCYAQLRVTSEYVRNYGLDSLQSVTNRLTGLLSGPDPEASHQPAPGAGSRDVSGEAEGLRAPDPAVQADGAAR